MSQTEKREQTDRQTEKPITEAPLIAVPMKHRDRAKNDVSNI